MKISNRFIRFIIIYLACLPTTYLAQYEPNWNFLNVDNGLSQNRVTDIIKDQYGYLYIATIDGLNRYDGFTNERVNIYKEESILLTDYSIETLYKDSYGSIWLGTGIGNICHKPVHSNDFYFVGNVSENKKNINNAVVQFCEDGDGSIWFVTEKNLFEIDSARNIYKIDKLKKEDNTRYINIIAHNNNLLIFCEQNNIIQYNPTDSSVTSLNDYLNEKPGSLMRHAVKNNDDSILLATDNNIYLINFSDNTAIKKSHGLKEVLRIEKDDRNNIWVGTTDSGIYRLNNFFDSNGTKHDLSPVEDRKENLASIRTMNYLKEGVLLLGTNGNGLIKIDYSSTKFGLITPNIPRKNSLLNKSIRAILPLNEEQIIIGGYAGLELVNLNSKSTRILFERDNDSTNFSIYSIFKDRFSENLWLGTEGSGLLKYNLKIMKPVLFSYSNEFHPNWITTIIKIGNRLLLGSGDGVKIFDLLDEEFVNTGSDAEVMTEGTMITSLVKDKHSNIWCTTKGNGVILFDESLNLVRSSLIRKREADNFPVDIKSLLITDNEQIWIGTNGNGLYNIDTSFNIITRYTTDQGLPNNTIYGIIESLKGDLWMSTNKGIVKFSPASSSFRAYSKLNKIQSNEFNTNAYAHLNNQLILFGGINGLNFFNPDKMESRFPEEKVIITQISSPAKTYDLLHEGNNDIDFSYQSEEIQINFIYPVYSIDAAKEFKYRFKRWGSKWEMVRGSNTIKFNNLDHGEFTFQIIPVEFNSDISNGISEINFSIYPPFYQSYWFIFLVVIIFLVTGPAIYILRTRRLEAERNLAKSFARKLIINQENERKRIAYDLHDNIAQQTLSLKMMVNNIRRSKKDVDKLDDLSIEAVKLAGNILNDVRNISHTMHPHILDKLGLVKSIESNIKHISLSTSIKFSINLDDYKNNFSKSDELLIYRIIQESINNLVKHSKADNCTISFYSRNNSCFFQVIDNGIGFSIDADKNLFTDKSLGFYSMKERAKLMDAQLVIDSNPGKGTIIKLYFDGK